MIWSTALSYTIFLRSASMKDVQIDAFISFLFKAFFPNVKLILNMFLAGNALSDRLLLILSEWKSLLGFFLFYVRALTISFEIISIRKDKNKKHNLLALLTNLELFTNKIFDNLNLPRTLLHYVKNCHF